MQDLKQTLGYEKYDFIALLTPLFVKKVESGKAIFDEALRLYPTDPTLHHAYANFLVTARNSLTVFNCVEQANTHYAMAVKYQPDSLDLLLDYGNFLKEIYGDTKKARMYLSSYQKLSRMSSFALKDSIRLAWS